MKKEEGLLGFLREVDILDPVEEQVASGSWPVDYKTFRVKGGYFPKAKNPWIMTRTAWDRDCGRWHHIFWQRYGLIPAGCMCCWKIVVQRIQTLRELMRLYDLQKKLDLPSKCGIEKRSYASGIYGGFFYAPIQEGLDGARKMWKEISNEVRAHVGGKTNVILKRGCTEMEFGAGPSDEWSYTERERAKEELLNSFYPSEVKCAETNTMLNNHIMRQWIEWAWIHGDKTWKDYAKDEDFKSCLEYHVSVHSHKDYPILPTEVRVYDDAREEYWEDPNKERYCPGGREAEGCEEASEDRRGVGEDAESGLLLMGDLQKEKEKERRSNGPRQGVQKAAKKARS